MGDMTEEMRRSDRSGLIRAMKPQDSFSKLVGVVLGGVCIAAVSGAWALNARLAAMTVKLETMETSLPSATEVALLKQELARVASDRARDDAQDRQLRRQWDLHSWERGRINAVEAEVGLPLTAPPAGAEP